MACFGRRFDVERRAVVGDVHREAEERTTLALGRDELTDFGERDVGVELQAHAVRAVLARDRACDKIVPFRDAGRPLVCAERAGDRRIADGQAPTRAVARAGGWRCVEVVACADEVPTQPIEVGDLGVDVTLLGENSNVLRGIVRSERGLSVCDVFAASRAG